MHPGAELSHRIESIADWPYGIINLAYLQAYNTSWIEKKFGLGDLSSLIRELQRPWGFPSNCVLLSSIQLIPVSRRVGAGGVEVELISWEMCAGKSRSCALVLDVNQISWVIAFGFDSFFLYFQNEGIEGSSQRCAHSSSTVYLLHTYELPRTLFVFFRYSWVE